MSINFFKKNNFEENRDETKKQYIKVFNTLTQEWESIPLSLYMNSFNDYNQNVKLSNILNLENDAFKNVGDEIIKNINISNITEIDDDTRQKEQIRKLRNYIKELEEEDLQKNEGNK